ncbi:MAG: hypothetical protein AAFX93_17810 [Verrucomicrobiota bacterium]
MATSSETAQRKEALIRRLPLLGFLLLAFVVLRTFGDYGVSWDEYFRWQGGEHKLLYYQSILDGDWETVREIRNQSDHYPGLFDLSLAVFRRAVPLSVPDSGHLWVALFGLVGVVGTYLAGKEIGGRWLGLLAAFFLVCTPRFWGHLFINPKDMPFAATFILAIWALLRVLGRPERISWASALLFGGLAGCCMAVRIGGWLLFCYAGLFLGLQVLWSWRNENWQKGVLIRETLKLTRWLVVAAVPALLILLAFWPNAHRNPFEATAGSLAKVSSFGWRGKLFFNGSYFEPGDIPAHYLPQMLLVTLPDYFYILLLSGIAVAICWRERLAGFIASRHAGLLAALAFSALFPIAYIIVRGSTVYDGIRHVLFVVPLVAIMSSYVALAAYRCFQEINPRIGIAWLSILSIAVGVTVFDMVRLHPYQYTYFNRLSGGLPAADNVHDVEYWGTAYREAVDIILADVPQPRGPVKVAILPSSKAIFAQHDVLPQPPIAMVAFFLPEPFTLVGPDDNPDYRIGIHRFGFNEMLSGETVGVIERDGVEFARVVRTPNDR